LFVDIKRGTIPASSHELPISWERSVPGTELLRRIPLLAGLTGRELDLIAQSSRRVQYPKKSIVFHEGDPGDYLLVILRGRVKVTLLSDDGRETIVAMLERPAFLGEVALLDEAPRSATVMTLEPTEFLQIGRASFKSLLTAHPAIAMKIMARLANELRRATEQIRTLSLFDVHGRVLRCLLMMAHDHGESAPTRMVIRPRPSVKDLALMIGCSRETVSRAMKLLQDSGYVSVVDRGLAIEHRAIRRYHLPSLQNLTPPEDTLA
jgi:CRP/FNR family transcriptional regulator, cyclic AMP receptor protein